MILFFDCTWKEMLIKQFIKIKELSGKSSEAYI